MKTVFTNAMCAHVWAQQTQPEGRANSMHFDGRVMYSYQTPIAMFHSVCGERVCLITSQSYSKTTSNRHMPPVWRAVKGAVFSVPWVGYENAARGMDASEHSHEANAKYLLAQYESCAARARRARNFDEQRVRDDLEQLATVVDHYCRVFGEKRPKLCTSVLVASIVRERAERSTPEAKAKRAKAAEKKREHEAAARAQRQYDWRHNRPVHFKPTDRFDVYGGALLRIVGANVVTSLGAVVPLEDARRALKFVKREHVPGRECPLSPALTGTHVGPFRIDVVHADGSVTAGCHKISATELGLFEASLAMLP